MCNHRKCDDDNNQGVGWLNIGGGGGEGTMMAPKQFDKTKR
jgi:hypothetical protein